MPAMRAYLVIHAEHPKRLEGIEKEDLKRRVGFEILYAFLVLVEELQLFSWWMRRREHVAKRMGAVQKSPSFSKRVVAKAIVQYKFF